MSYPYKLYGAIYGDIVGKPYEHDYKGDYTNIDMFPKDSSISDDTLMTLASAKSILEDRPASDCYYEMGNKYPDEKYGYGKNFRNWLEGKECFTNSYGNGSIMRISPFIWLDYTKNLTDSIKCTHDHQDCMAAAIRLHLLYKKSSRFRISNINKEPNPKFLINAYDTYQIVEKMFYYGKETDTIEDYIRNVIGLGGDTDTNASILGELVNYKQRRLSKEIVKFVESHLDNYLLTILKNFNNEF